MTKKELLERLKRERIPQKGMYAFDTGKWGDEFVLSNPTSNVWEVNYYDRGEYSLMSRFSSETEACEYFYREIKKYWNPSNSQN